MNVTARYRLLLIVVFVSATGCQTGWQMGGANSVGTTVAQKSGTKPRELPNGDRAESQASFETPVTYGAPNFATNAGQPPEVAMAQIVGEIAELGAIDSAAQQQLIKQLQAAKPAHYPLVVQQFKSAYAYSRELRERSNMAPLSPLEALPATAEAGPRLLPAARFDDPPMSNRQATEASRNFQ